MILVIVTHHAKPGMGEAAQRRIRAYTERMTTMPGLLFRYVLLSTVDSHRIVTITTWKSHEHYEEWQQQLRVDTTTKGEMSAETPYVRVEAETFLVHDSWCAK